jgi:hypothetical protein
LKIQEAPDIDEKLNAIENEINKHYDRVQRLEKDVED